MLYFLSNLVYFLFLLSFPCLDLSRMLTWLRNSTIESLILFFHRGSLLSFPSRPPNLSPACLATKIAVALICIYDTTLFTFFVHSTNTFLSTLLKPAPFHNGPLLIIFNMSFIICFSSSFLVSLSVICTLISPFSSSTCSGSGSIDAASYSSNSSSTIVTLRLISSNSTEVNHSSFLIALA